MQALIPLAGSPVAALLFLTLWRAGLRVSEALALLMADFSLDSEHPTVHIRHGKGNRPRRVPLHPELQAALRSATTFGSAGRGPLFPITRFTALRWIKDTVGTAEQLGVLPTGRRVTTHTFRHSAARHWLASGIPINVVSRWLGHASLQTTLIYLEILPDPLGDMSRVP